MNNKSDKQQLITRLNEVINFLQDDNVLLERSDVDKNVKLYEAKDDGSGSLPYSTGVDFNISVDTVYVNKKSVL